MTTPRKAVAACALCAREGDFSAQADGRSRFGLCPDCVTAGRPTRDGLEQAVVIVARQQLAAAERVALDSVSPEQMAYHFGTVIQNLRSVLLLFNILNTPKETGNDAT
jgi:hypothetical protein